MSGIKVKEIIGIRRQKPNDKGFIPSTIYFFEPFDEAYDGESLSGFQTGDIYTTLDTQSLKVGDRFKALYDVGRFWNKEKRVFENRPVLAEILPLQDKK